MNRIKYKSLLEYLSLTLVLSYLIFHNVLMIISGMIIALYCTGKEGELQVFKINRRKKEVKFKSKRETKEKIHKQQVFQICSESDLKLIQNIEEFGFIPSINTVDKEIDL